MMRPLSARLSLAVLALSVFIDTSPLCPAWAQAPPAPGPNPGQFFTIEQPIRSEVVERLQASTRALVEQAAARGRRPVLIFEVRPGKSDFGAAYDLADFIQKKLAGAQTVAYVPEPLSGYAVLTALACHEIVLGPDAALGPITPPGEEVRNDLRETLRTLATRQGREPDLLVGMLDPSADLRKLRTADGPAHYVLAEHRDEFQKTHPVLDDQPAWDPGARGTLAAERARSEGLVKQIVEDRAQVTRAYNLAGAADDPTLGQELSPVLIRVAGPLDPYQESYLRRRVAQARQERDNLIVFQIDSEGGLDQPADGIADLIAGIKDMKTVAFIDDHALGVSALVALA
ncbi:MAG TPA: serine protease, partial [Isosphaeraceae bacterium]